MSANVRVDGLVEYTQSQIENRAREFLRSRVDVSLGVPIDVELLLENTADVRLQTLPGLLNKYSVEGCVCNQFMTKNLVVFVDVRIADGANDSRYNAVVAEELAHIQLHRALLYQVKTVEDFIEVRTHPKWRMIERDAQLFSCAVRMPQELVSCQAETAYPKLVDLHGFADPYQIEKLMRNHLAETFAVPYQEMHARLQQWPCDVYKRVNVSVQAGSCELMRADWTVDVHPPTQQMNLLDDGEVL